MTSPRLIIRDQLDRSRNSEKVPWARPTFWGAVAFLLLVAVLAAWLVVDSASEPSGTATNPKADTSKPDQAPSATGLAPASDDIPTETPNDVDWELWRGIALPISESAGPAAVDGDMAKGYAHTPTGAVVAASNITYRAVFGEKWREVTEESVAPGEGRDEFIRQLSQPIDHNDTSGAAQLAGFRVLSYTPTATTVEMVTSSNDGTLAASVTTLVWSSDDWRLQLLPDGSLATKQVEVSSLDGYVQWSGVS